jgi:hypothetical protein
MFDREGIDDKTGITWSVKSTGNGLEFLICVGEQSRTYTLSYNPIFGMDLRDMESINHILDALFEEAATIAKCLS